MSKPSTDHQKQIQNYFNQTVKESTGDIIRSFINVLEMYDNSTESAKSENKYHTTRLFSTLKNFAFGDEPCEDYYQKSEERYYGLFLSLIFVHHTNPKAFREIILYFEKRAFELFDKKKQFHVIKQELLLVVDNWKKEEPEENEEFKEVLNKVPESVDKTTKDLIKDAPTNLRIKDMVELENIEERIVEIIINQLKTNLNAPANISEVFDNCLKVQETKGVLFCLEKTLFIDNKKEMVKCFKEISNLGICFALAMMIELKEVCVLLGDYKNQMRKPIEILEISRKKIKEELEHDHNAIFSVTDYENEVEIQENELLQKKGEKESELNKIRNIETEIETFRKQCLETDKELNMAQRIAIPFEKWFNGDIHQVVIYLNEKKRIMFNIQINSTIPNGYLYEINDKIKLRLNFVHPFYRRKGNDVIYYLRKNEISMGFKQSIKTPGGPHVKFDPSSFQKATNYELSFEGYGFKDKNEVGRFIIKLIGDDEAIPQPQDELTEMRMKDRLELENLQKQLRTSEDKQQSLQKEIDQMESSLEETKKRKEEHERIIRQKEERKKIFVQCMSGWSGIEGIISKARKEHYIEEKTLYEAAIITKFRYDPNYSDPTHGKMIFKNADKTITVVKLVDNKNNYSTMRSAKSTSFFSSSYNTYYMPKKENYTKKEGNDLIEMYQLFKECPRIQVININVPSDFNANDYYPLIIGNSSQFGIDKNETEIILPIKLPNVYNTIYQSIFVNGYESKSGGLIIVNIQRTQTNTRTINEPTYFNGQNTSYPHSNYAYPPYNPVHSPSYNPAPSSFL